LGAYLTNVTDGTRPRTVGITAEIQTGEPQISEDGRSRSGAAPKTKIYGTHRAGEAETHRVKREQATSDFWG
jgi:hypothetical protein